MNNKKLYKKTDGQMMCGVCNGLADYLEVDVSIVRIATVILSLGSVGLGLLIYIAAAVILPTQP